jgi:hypothetical protein
MHSSPPEKEIYGFGFGLSRFSVKLFKNLFKISEIGFQSIEFFSICWYFS